MRRYLAERVRGGMEAIMNVMCEGQSDLASFLNRPPNERALRKGSELYEGRGRGSRLNRASRTAWALLNAVTRMMNTAACTRSNRIPLIAWLGISVISERALRPYSPL